MNDKFLPHKSLFGLDANIVMLIAYFGSIILTFVPGIGSIAWVIPIAIYFLEKDSQYVKFHAAQSFLLGVTSIILAIITGIIIAILGGIIVLLKSTLLLAIIGFVSIFLSIGIPITILIFAIIVAVKAWKYESYTIPFVSDWTIKLMKKI